MLALLIKHLKLRLKFFTIHAVSGELPYSVRSCCCHLELKLDWIVAQRNMDINLMYVCPCIIYEIDERYPLDATIYLLL